MSFFPGKDPKAGDAYACDAIAQVIAPRTVDLGDGFSVRRALPSARTRMVGPFIFFDHFGPAEFRAGSGLDVRPHPHIGLATVTYLFDGEIMHRDSLGTEAPIKPGEVNLMTAGRGIVHSERTGAELRTTGSPIHGLQMWVALPAAKEEMAPGFAHHEVAGVSDGARRGRVRARRHRLALRRDIAGADRARDNVREYRAAARRNVADRCRPRRARALSGRRHARYCRRQIRAGPASGVQAGRQIDGEGRRPTRIS